MDFYYANWDEMWHKFPAIREKRISAALVSAFDIVRRYMASGPQSAVRLLEKRLGAIQAQEWPTKVMLDPGTYSVAQATGDNERVGRGVTDRGTAGRLIKHSEWAIRIRTPGWLESYSDGYVWCAEQLTEQLPGRDVVFMELDFQHWMGAKHIQEARKRLAALGQPVIYIYHGLTGPDLDDAMKEADRSSEPSRVLKSHQKDAPKRFVDSVMELGGDRFAIGNLDSYVESAIPHDWKEHGLGVSSLEELAAVRYTSVDSTRWIAPSYWGEIDILDRTSMTMKRVTASPKRKREFDPQVLEKRFLQPITDQESIGRLIHWQINEWQEAIASIERYWRQYVENNRS